MATEFNDSLHKTFFMEGDTLRNGNGYSIRVSEIILAGLRSAGILDNMVDGTSPPSDITKLWLDKNFDPAVLKLWETAGSSWRVVTFTDFFGLFDPLNTVKLNTTADGVASVYTLGTPGPTVVNGYIYIDVYVGGVIQPKDGLSYTIITGGTQIQFSEVPPAGMTIYVEGVANFYESVSAAAASLIPNDSSAPGTYVKDALNYIFNNGTSFAAWPSAVTKTMKERATRICHVGDFDTDPDGGNDSTSGLVACLAEAQAAKVPMLIGNGDGGAGDFIIEQELEVTQPGQIVRFDMTGGAGTEDDFGLTWSSNGRLIAAGNWWSTTGKRVRSRRLFRGSIADPQDAPMSTVINIQARGASIEKPSIWLEKDYTLSSPTDYGDNVDVAIFSGCRAAVKIISPTIVGHFRKAGVYWDVTHRFGLDRHLDKAGNPYPDEGEFSGADGCYMYEPVIRGSWKAIAILGARPKIGQTAYTDPYYDQQLGGTISDGRGAVGFSDFHCVGGQMWSVDHGTSWRSADPTLSGGVLNQTSLLAEPDSMPAVVHIDGLAANSSGAIWNMSFHRCRFATIEAFRTRLDFASRVTFDNCHWDGRNSGTRKDTSGNVIDTNDYTVTTYGDVSATPNTSRVKVLGTPRANKADGIGPHYYGPMSSFHFETANGSIATHVFEGTEEADIRGASGTGVRFRSGASTIGAIAAVGIDANTTASGANVFVNSSNVLFKSTSTGLLKTDVEDIDTAHRDSIVMGARPVWYRSLAPADNPDWSWYGLIAEEVAAIDPRLVHWTTERLVIKTRVNSEGETEEYEEVVPLETPLATGVMYERFVPAMLAKLQEQEQRLAALEGGAA